MRILIAEDDRSSRLILEAAVSQLGHDFVSAVDGDMAWRLFQTNKVDAVISDRSMPFVDGLELCRRIRAAPNAGYPYFIFLTALSDKDRISDGMDAGADDYLGKPLDLDELSARLVVAERISQLYHQLAIQRAELERLNLKLFEQTRTDPLTQLGSRLKLSEDLALIATRIARDCARYCAVMADIDLFKMLNDLAGHIAGDQILRDVARALSNAKREGDEAYRYGGEEFLLILPVHSLDDGLIMAERLRAAVAALNIPHPTSPSGRVTVSIGVSMLSLDRANSMLMGINEADTALYSAKRQGRNRVCQHA
jgi:two-component system cell cycle response regulator